MKYEGNNERTKFHPPKTENTLVFEQCVNYDHFNLTIYNSHSNCNPRSLHISFHVTGFSFLCFPVPFLSLIDFLKVLWKDGLLILSTLSCPKGITDDQRVHRSVILSKTPCSGTIREQNQEIKSAVFPLVYVHNRFRMRQVNVVGSSPFSQPSRVMQTLQASPDVAAANLSVLSATETSLRICWEVRMGLTHTWKLISSSC